MRRPVFYSFVTFECRRADSLQSVEWSVTVPWKFFGINHHQRKRDIFPSVLLSDSDEFSAAVQLATVDLANDLITCR
jgi:hypothetical protein